MFEIYGGGTELKQWELNKTVTNPCMKEGDDVVFRNAHGQTYVVKAFEEGGVIQADVPNYLLQKSGNILVDLEQGLEHHTECRTTFAVVAQDKPENYDCQCNVPDRPVKAVGGVSSWNDLTDKPFGEETVEEAIFENVSLTWDSNEGGYVAFDPSKSVSLSAGDSIRVVIDGVVYNTVLTDDNSAGILLGGNAGLWELGENTGEPFLFAVEADVPGIVVSGAEGETHVVSVYTMAFSTIDEKFLPESVRCGVTTIYVEGFSGTTTAYKDENATIPFGSYADGKAAFEGGLVHVKKIGADSFMNPVYVAFVEKTKKIGLILISDESQLTFSLKFSDSVLPEV